MQQGFSSMSTKLKLILGFLVVIAVISLYIVGSSLNNLAKNSTANIGSGTADQPQNGIVSIASNDSDNDGLPDADETQYDTDPFKADTDGDGYLDGEEVLAGTNPTEKNPAVEKQQIKDSKNLTTSYLQTLVGGYMSGDLKGDSNNPADLLASLDVLSSTVLEDMLSQNTQKPSSSVLLVIDSSSDDVKDYLVQATNLMNAIPPQEKYLLNDTTSNATYAAMAFIFHTVNQKFNALAVPQQFAEWHQQTARTLAKCEVLYRGLANGNQDPVRAMVSLELFPTTLGDLAISGNQLNIYLNEYKINKTVHPYIDLSKNF